MTYLRTRANTWVYARRNSIANWVMYSGRLSCLPVSYSILAVRRDDRAKSF